MTTYTPIYPYKSQGEDELDLNINETIEILSKDPKISGDSGWWVGRVNNQIGIIPSNFVIPTNKILKNIQITNLIGEGGFSKVYHGCHGNKSVAVKVPNFNVNVESVVREGKISELLSHKNIVGFLGFYGESIVMEFCPGGGLNLNLVGLNLGEVGGWAGQICEGMGYLHTVGVVHRDLKSSNVLLSHPRTPHHPPPLITLKITDFGLAREIDQTTRMSTAGTYAWMSPEVIKSSTFSKAADVWSYAVLLWELLTSEVPYKGIEPFTIAYGIAVNKLTLPVSDSCPEEWGQLMQACWSQDPHSRPTFQQIKRMLATTAQTDNDKKNFIQIQETWRAEIEGMLKERIEDKEKELQSREATLAKIYELQKTHEDYLKFVERQLREKEITLLERELTIALKPEPRKRRMRSKFNNGRRLEMDFISQPKDFRHKLNIQPVVVGDLLHRGHQSQSSPNLVEIGPASPAPINKQTINSVIYRMGAMATAAIGVDLDNGNHATPQSTNKQQTTADLKYYTYAGRSAKRRSSLPKVSTEV